MSTDDVFRELAGKLHHYFNQLDERLKFMATTAQLDAAVLALQNADTANQQYIQSLLTQISTLQAQVTALQASPVDDDAVAAIEQVANDITPPAPTPTPTPAPTPTPTPTPPPQV